MNETAYTKNNMNRERPPRRSAASKEVARKGSRALSPRYTYSPTASTSASTPQHSLDISGLSAGMRTPQDGSPKPYYFAWDRDMWLSYDDEVLKGPKYSLTFADATAHLQASAGVSSTQLAELRERSGPGRRSRSASPLKVSGNKAEPDTYDHTFRFQAPNQQMYLDEGSLSTISAEDSQYTYDIGDQSFRPRHDSSSSIDKEWRALQMTSNTQHHEQSTQTPWVQRRLPSSAKKQVTSRNLSTAKSTSPEIDRRRTAHRPVSETFPATEDGRVEAQRGRSYLSKAPPDITIPRIRDGAFAQTSQNEYRHLPGNPQHYSWPKSNSVPQAPPAVFSHFMQNSSQSPHVENWLLWQWYYWWQMYYATWQDYGQNQGRTGPAEAKEAFKAS